METEQEINPNEEWKNEENLRKLALEDNLSNQLIADKYNVSKSVIDKLLRRFKITRTNPPIRKNKHINTTDDLIIEKAKISTSVAGLLKNLGYKDTGGHRTWIKGKIIKLHIDTSHFTGYAWNKGNGGKRVSIPLSEILKENSTYDNNTLRKRLIKEGVKEAKCECCGNTEWNGKPIPLQLHHKNGDHFDNRLENLEILCPNCHAQTDNFGSKNKKSNSEHSNYIPPITGEELLNKVKELGYIYKIANHYNVSETTIRKWIKSLNIRDEFKKEREKWKQNNKFKS